jgi:Tricorn protease C1 domain
MHRLTPSTTWLAIVGAIVLCVGASAPILAQDASPGASPAVDACVEPEASATPLTDGTLSMPEDYRIALFNGVWQGVRDLYIDADTNGLDWQAIGDEYATLLIQTENAQEV